MLQIAKVLKSNGVDGGLLMGFRPIAPEDLNLKEPVYIYFDGLPVPFFIDSLTPKGVDKAIVHLTDVHNLKDAEELVGLDVFAEMDDDWEDEEDFSFLVGWTLKGAGPVTDFIDIPGNPCLEVDVSGKSVIVPLNEELIKGLDKRRHVLDMDIPEGLLDL